MCCILPLFVSFIFLVLFFQSHICATSPVLPAPSTILIFPTYHHISILHALFYHKYLINNIWFLTFCIVCMTANVPELKLCSYVSCCSQSRECEVCLSVSMLLSEIFELVITIVLTVICPYIMWEDQDKENSIEIHSTEGIVIMCNTQICALTKYLAWHVITT